MGASSSLLLLQPPSSIRAVNLIVASSPARLQEDVAVDFGQTKKGTISAPGQEGCLLGSTQYVFNIEEEDCEPVFFGLSIFLINLNNQEIKLYARIGQKVAIEEGKVIADYYSDPISNGKSLLINAANRPPLQPGKYYFAVSNCGSEAADYELIFSGSFIDYFSPFALITRVEIKEDELLMYGCYPKKGAKLFLNRERKGSIRHDERRPHGLVISKKADKIAPGKTVKLHLKFRNGIISNEFKFTRPIN